jgi:hypothetical protein
MRDEKTEKDPLDLKDKEIRRYREEIIETLVGFGRSKKAAARSADRWEKTLEETRREFEK